MIFDFVHILVIKFHDLHESEEIHHRKQTYNTYIEKFTVFKKIKHGTETTKPARGMKAPSAQCRQITVFSGLCIRFNGDS